jgi:hypothetical protein
MQAFDRGVLRRAAVPLGLSLAFLAWLGADVARAQSPAPAPGWYGYTPGRGWVRYAPASAPAVTSAAPAPRAPVVPAPSGWAYYDPARGWIGYAPASSPTYPNPAVRPRSRVLPADGSRRRAASYAVNHIAPELSYTLPAYREFGTGRNIPLAKPWLPPSP